MDHLDFHANLLLGGQAGSSPALDGHFPVPSADVVDEVHDVCTRPGGCPPLAVLARLPRATSLVPGRGGGLSGSGWLVRAVPGAGSAG